MIQKYNIQSKLPPHCCFQILPMRKSLVYSKGKTRPEFLWRFYNQSFFIPILFFWSSRWVVPIHTALYLLFVNNNFVEKWVLKIVNWIYVLLRNNHLGNIFAEVITIKMLFASAKTSAIASCRGKFWGLKSQLNFKIVEQKSY